MAYQLNEGQGSLFTNPYKNVNDPNDRSPHLKGRCVVNGVEKEIAGWWAYPQNGGQPYIQLKISDPRPRQQQPGYAPQQGYPQQPQGGYAPQPQQSQYQPQPQCQQYAQTPVQQPQRQQPQYSQPPAQAPAQPQYQQPGNMQPQGGSDDLPFD